MAWRATSFGARWLYVHLKRRWSFKQRNNGRIFLSQRDAQEEMGAGTRDSISRWFRELQHYGFIVMTDSGGLGVDRKGKAPHWRLTELEAPGGRNGDTLMLPTKDFNRWDGVRFADDRGAVKRDRNRKQNPGPQTKARVARKPGPGLARKTKATSPANWPANQAHTGHPPGPQTKAISRSPTRVVRGRGVLSKPAQPPALVPYSERGLDERHSREGLMAYVASVIEEQLDDLPQRAPKVRRAS